jgi:hypothetical protein
MLFQKYLKLQYFMEEKIGTLMLFQKYLKLQYFMEEKIGT